MASLHPQPEKPLLFYIFSDLSFCLIWLAIGKIWKAKDFYNNREFQCYKYKKLWMKNLKSLRGLHWRLTFWIIQRFPDFSQMNQRWYYSIFNTEKMTLFLLVSWIRFVNDLTTLKYGWMSNESAAHDHDLYFMKIKKKYLKNWKKQISISWKWRKK